MSTNFEDLIGRGATGAKPAAGIPGRLYYDTTLEQLERDNGVSWDVCEPAGGGLAGLIDSAEDSSTRNYTTNNTWQDISGTTITFTPESGATYKVTFTCVWQFNSANWAYHQVRAAIDAVASGAPSAITLFLRNDSYNGVLNNTVVFLLDSLGTSEVDLTIQTHDMGSEVDRQFTHTFVVLERVL